MRTATKVKPVSLVIDFYILVFRNCIYQFNLVELAFIRKNLFGFFTRQYFFRKFRIAPDNFMHFLFNYRQVFRRKRLITSKIIIKAVFNNRANSDLCTRKEFLHSFGKNVRTIMTDECKCTGIIAGDNLDRTRLPQRVGHITQDAVKTVGNSIFC